MVGEKIKMVVSCVDVACQNRHGQRPRHPFPTDGGKRSPQVLGLVHSNVCGKLNEKSLGGGQYFLTFIDDKTRYTWVYILKNKSEVFEKFLEWRAEVENVSGKRLKVLRTDNGGEYTSREFEAYLKKAGIRHEKTIPRNPEQNGVAERMNRTLMEMVRSLLSDSHLPQVFWAEALSTAVYFRNRSPTKAVTAVTPFEAWSGDQPDLIHLRRFGCLAYSHVSKEERQKLDVKARECIMLGYGVNEKGYRLYDVEKRKVFHSRDVVFYEEVNGAKERVSHPCSRLEHISNASPFDVEDQNEGEDQYEKEDQNGRKDQDQEEYQENENNHENETEGEDRNTGTNEREEGETQVNYRPKRVRRAPSFYGEWVNTAITEPSSVKEALTGEEKEKWREAMEVEMESIKRNNVWELVELPKGRSSVGSKWVFKKKVNEEGVVKRYKARIVAQGFSQKFGLDYDETFCPVVRFESVRTVIALSVQHSLRIHQMDVTAAFLNGDLQEEVFMSQPEGFVAKGQEHLVCRLNRSLYGLKQSPRCWNEVLHNSLQKMGFQQSSSDACIYTAKEGEMFIIAVYVDDIMLAGRSAERMTEIKNMLSRRFNVKDMGPLHYFLGVKVEQNEKNGSIWVGQPAYCTSLLQKFGMEHCKPVKNPVSTTS